MDIIKAGSPRGPHGWRNAMKSQVAETILVTLMCAAAAASVYLAAALVVRVLA
jgi:hypothetical protein